MSNLVLIRHSQTRPDPNLPSRLWPLTEEGRRRCEPLAEQLVPYTLHIVVTSTEPKAIQTGELVARKLSIPCRVMENLHEHERESMPHFETLTEFQKTVKTLFSRPSELIFGEETALQAQERFASAFEAVLAAYPLKNVAIVTHGTVLSLFASQHTGQENFTFWRNLGLPAFMAFSYPEMKLLAQVNEIT